MSTPSVIVGIQGPLENLSDALQVFLFESSFFDSSSRSSTSAARITLENRWEAVLNPTGYVDNLVGGQDMFEYELKSFRGPKTVVCLHSNKILLDGSKESVEKFKDTCKRYSDKFQFLLSISLPPETTGEDFESMVEYLVSHVHYGSAKGLYFGAIGPFVLDSPATSEIYLEAQKRTGAPLFAEVAPTSSLDLLDSIDCSKILLIVRDFDTASRLVSRIGNTKKLNLVVPCCDQGIDPRFKDLPDCTIFFSPGCSQKIHFKKFGGLGFDSLRGHVNSDSAAALSLLAFPWNPPKLNGQQDDDYGKWVCDICGLRAKLSEKENFTKHGYTYCSIACLASHRKRGFEPLS